MRVNHRIKCRNKLRAPGAREKKQLILEAMDRKEIPFSIVGDIKKARRRFKHLAKEQGFLACQLDARAGPVGQLDNSCVNCASYWWTRVAACGIRATHHVGGLPLCRRPGGASYYPNKTDSHHPQLLVPHGARVSLEMVQDQRGIPGRVARCGDGVFQLQARPHREESQLVGGLAAREDSSWQRHC